MTHTDDTAASIEVDLREPVRRLTKFLNLVGLWPAISRSRQNDDEQPATSCCSRLSRLAYTLYAIVFQLIFTIAYDSFKCINFLHMTDLSVITRAMFICLTELSLAVKIVNFWLRMDTMQRFLANIEHGVRLRERREHRTVDAAFAVLRRVILWFLVTANTTGVFSYVSPVLVAEPMLPYPGWYPLDWQHSTRDYWFVWLYQVLGMFFQIQSLVIIEVYFIYLMVVASAQLDVLGGRIERIGYKEDGGDTVAEQTLMECIRAHTQVLKFTSSIEMAGSIPYFVQFVLSGIVLCVAVFQIAILNPTQAIAEFVFYVGFVLTMLTQIFLPCYFGNEIALKSEFVSRAVYNSNWPCRSHRYRRLVMVYLEMLRRPRRLVVGQLFSLTLDSFLLVLNRAYSMYAVVQSFAE